MSGSLRGGDSKCRRQGCNLGVWLQSPPRGGRPIRTKAPLAASPSTAVPRFWLSRQPRESSELPRCSRPAPRPAPLGDALNAPPVRLDPIWPRRPHLDGGRCRKALAISGLGWARGAGGEGPQQGS